MVRIADGDTIRCRHIPLAWNRLEGKDAMGLTTGRLYHETLLLRLCGVDAPETAKFGHSGQPFSKEATDFVRNACLNSIVWIKLLGRDQYGRPLVVVWIPPPKTFWCCCTKPPRDIGEALLSEGLATMYYGKGAQYGGKKEIYEKRVEEARNARKGIWSLGSDIRESPRAYKRRTNFRNQQDVTPESLKSVDAAAATVHTPKVSPLKAKQGRQAQTPQQAVWTGWRTSNTNKEEEQEEDTSYGQSSNTAKVPNKKPRKSKNRRKRR